MWQMSISALSRGDGAIGASIVRVKLHSHRQYGVGVHLIKKGRPSYWAQLGRPSVKNEPTVCTCSRESRSMNRG